MLVWSVLDGRCRVDNLVFKFLFMVSLLFVTVEGESLSLSPFRVACLRSLVGGVDGRLPLCGLPSGTSNLGCLVVSCISGLFLGRGVRFRVDGSLITCSSCDFGAFWVSDCVYPK